MRTLWSRLFPSSSRPHDAPRPHDVPRPGVLGRLWRLFRLARRALAVAVLAVAAVVVIAIAHGGADDQAPSKSEQRHDVQQRREHDEKTQAQMDADRKADPETVLTVAVGASEAASGLDGDADEAAGQLASLQTTLRAADVVLSVKPQGTDDARTLLALLDTRGADALLAQTGVPGSPNPEAVAAALGVVVRCDNLAAQWRALHKGAATRGLALLRFSDAAQTGALPSRLLVVRRDALARLPQLAPAVAAADAQTVLLLDSDEGVGAALAAALGDETVERAQVPTALRDADISTVSAAATARVARIAALTQTADALDDAFGAADQGQKKRALAALAGADETLLSARGRKALQQVRAALSPGKHGGGEETHAAADTLLELSEAAAEQRGDESTGTDAALAHEWSQLVADPTSAVTTATCPVLADTGV